MSAAIISDLRSLIEDPAVEPREKISLLLPKIRGELDRASVGPEEDLVELKRSFCRNRILHFCIDSLSGNHDKTHSEWSNTALLAHTLSTCCVGAEPEEDPEVFYQLFLPSVMDVLLSSAGQLMTRAAGSTEYYPLYRKVMDSIRWLLHAHHQLSEQVLSSLQYEQMWTCDDVSVALCCISLWNHINREFLSELTNDSVLLLLNDVVSQLAASSDTEVGAAAVRLLLLIAHQLDARRLVLFNRFKGLDCLLVKDWRGRGFNHDIDQLISILNSNWSPASRTHPQMDRVRAACVIQAVWRAHQTRSRLKKLPGAVSALQRRYRSKVTLQQQQQQAARWEEELKYQVCVRRQQARRLFHQKQQQLIQQLPPEQVQQYVSTVHRLAAVTIQTFWRKHRERRRYRARQHTYREQQAACTLQRAVMRFLRRRRALKASPTVSLLIGQKGLTDMRRAELKKELEEYISLHPSSIHSQHDCFQLHLHTQNLLLQHLHHKLQQHRSNQCRLGQDQHSVLGQINTQLELLENAPALSVATEMDVSLFRSRSTPVAARARQSHNALLRTGSLPWWRRLGEADDDGGTSCLEDFELGV